MKPPVWYDHNADNPPWIKALADVPELYCAADIARAIE
jgi:hypothetical protein